MICTWLCLAGTAHATTLAVLPLDPGAAGSELDGLGDALAGMITTDLASAPSLTLVERRRLDALLAEIELGKGGFIDPETAGKLGRGLGAEVVLLGTYTVVEQTLAMNVRVVRVESGQVLEGATASGPLAEFVNVEKELVELLLPRLQARLDVQARRSFYTNVPTDDWGAFTAYSRGQARAAAGEVEAARKAFQEALARDPAFVQAADALSTLEKLVADTRDADRANRQDRYFKAESSALDALPDPRVRTPGSPWTSQELAGVALRFTVLLNRDRNCERYDEMLAYLEQVDWDPEGHADQVGRLRASYRDLAEAHGITSWDKDVPHNNDLVYAGLSGREAGLWGDLTEFLFDGVEDGSARRHQGLMWSLAACHPEARQAQELARWRKRLRQTGMGDRREREDGLSVAEQLTVAEAWADAGDGRLTPRSQKALAALVARYPDTDTRAHEAALHAAEAVARRADHQDRWHVGRLGLTESTIRSRLEALARAEAPFSRTAAPWCGPGWDKLWSREAGRRLRLWDESLDDRSSTWHDVHRSAKLVRTVGDMGCFEGVPATLSSFDDAVANARRLEGQRHPTRYDPDLCDSLIDMSHAQIAHPGPGAGKPTFDLHSTMLQLVQYRCIVETR